MVRFDIVRLQMLEAAMAESKRKMKNACITVSDIISQMNRENSMYELKNELNLCMESMEQDLYILGQLDECLQQILPIYIRCEEGITEFTEEVQIAKLQLNKFKQVEIPEWIFQMLG